MEGIIIGFAIGCVLGTIAHFINITLYRKILVSKAKSDNNVEFIFGEPYVIMTEDKYTFMRSKIPFSGVKYPEPKFEKFNT